MALFEVTLRSTYQGQQIINRWNYVNAGTPAAVTRSFALWSKFTSQIDTVPGGGPDAFGSNGVMLFIANISHTEMRFNDLTVLNVYDPLDFYSSGFSFTANGVSGGEAASPLLAYGFRGGQVRRDIRGGQKRFAGVSETNVGAGGRLTDPALVALNELGLAMARTLVYTDEGNEVDFIPCIVKKQEYVPNPQKPSAKAYRYWKVDGNTPEQNEALQLQNIAVGAPWSPVATIRSQTSRQYGKGR